MYASAIIPDKGRLWSALRSLTGFQPWLTNIVQSWEGDFPAEGVLGESYRVPARLNSFPHFIQPTNLWNPHDPKRFAIKSGAALIRAVAICLFVLLIAFLFFAGLRRR
jgi:hypothetical protein